MFWHGASAGKGREQEHAVSQPLIWPDSGEVRLAIQLPAIGESDVRDQDPIARHRQLQVALIDPRFGLIGSRGDRCHARVRHISFDVDARAYYRPVRRICQPDRRGGETHSRRPGFDLQLHRYAGRRLGALCAAGIRNSSGTEHHRATKSQLTQAWLPRGCHSHEHLACRGSPAGGNIWKYMPMTIGRNTMLL